MKKIIALVLSLVMAFALVGCGGSTQEQSEAPEVAIASSEELLNKVWEQFGEDRQFPVMGGDPANLADGSAAAFSLEDKDAVLSFLHISGETAAMADGAASMIHAMNANTFTAAAFHMADAAQLQAFIEAAQADISSTQWMCGFPETLVIYSLCDYAVYALGNSDIVEAFKTAVSAAYGENAVIAVEEPLG